MRKCTEAEADVIIDGVHWRLDSLAELKQIDRIIVQRGIRFVNVRRTRLRLGAEEWDRKHGLRAGRDREGDRDGERPGDPLEGGG